MLATLALALAQPAGSASQADPQSATYICRFDASAEAADSDSGGAGNEGVWLALFLPDFGRDTSGTAIEAVDPSGILLGRVLTSFRRDGDSLVVFTEAYGGDRTLIVSAPRSDSILFTTVVSTIAAPDVRRYGYCMSITRNARAMFDHYRQHPDQFARDPVGQDDDYDLGELRQ